MRTEKSTHRAFTLIELLVVIAIIALLVGILLPALGKARLAGWKTVSLSNIRQITTAAYSYREDNKQYMPIGVTYERGMVASPYSGSLIGWATWQFGGKNCQGDWASLFGGGWDVEAADRPLNPYLYPSVEVFAPNAPAKLAFDDPTRQTLQMPVYKDPAERVSFERSPDVRVNPTESPISAYDDVGSSYQFNVKWWDQVSSLGTIKGFELGCQRMRLADTFVPSRFVWINDQYADIVANNVSTSFRLKNSYKDTNKSVMGFMDGHANYLPVRPGSTASSYTNSDYTFVFDDLRH